MAMEKPKPCDRCGHSECWKAQWSPGTAALLVDISDPHSWYLDGDTWRCHTCIAQIVGGGKPCD